MLFFVIPYFVYATELNKDLRYAQIAICLISQTVLLFLEIIRIMAMKWSYLQSPWNIVHLFQIVIFIIQIILREWIYEIEEIHEK